MKMKLISIGAMAATVTCLFFPLSVSADSVLKKSDTATGTSQAQVYAPNEEKKISDKTYLQCDGSDIFVVQETVVIRPDGMVIYKYSFGETLKVLEKETFRKWKILLYES